MRICPSLPTPLARRAVPACRLEQALQWCKPCVATDTVPMDCGGSSYRNNDRAAKDLVASLPSVDSSAHLCLRADVCDPTAVQRAVADVVEQMGAIDILVSDLPCNVRRE